ncbi:MAG: 4Fe-4S binding protein [Methanospirillum sp.]|nr:4Fe-4S binding protein [Methanospirillum sp.]
MAAKVDKDLCVGCETCIDVCPSEAIAMVDGVAEIDEDKCVDCNTCVDECPSAAITPAE